MYGSTMEKQFAHLKLCNDTQYVIGEMLNLFTDYEISTEQQRDYLFDLLKSEEQNGYIGDKDFINRKKSAFYELYVGKSYEDRGDTVTYRGLQMGHNYDSVNLIVAHQDGKYSFLRCLNADISDQITATDVKVFIYDYKTLRKEFHRYQKENCFARFVTSDKDIFQKSAKGICKKYDWLDAKEQEVIFSLETV